MLRLERKAVTESLTVIILLLFMSEDLLGKISGVMNAELSREGSTVFFSDVHIPFV